MKLRFLAKCRAGGEHRDIGDIVDLPNPEASHLISIGRAMEYKPGPEAATNQPANSRPRAKRGRPRKKG